MNPEDASVNGIDDGNVVELYNDQENVLLYARVTERVLKGTLWAPRPLTGLNGEPLNTLAPSTAQRIGGGPIFNSIRVRIRK